MNQLKIALLGAGRIGQVHTNTLATRVSSAQLVAVADVNLAAAQASASPLDAINGHDGKMAFVIALAAKKSFAEKRPVKISEIQ